MFLLITTLVKFVVFALLFILPLAAVLTWMERRQSAYSQDRLGPQRAEIRVFGHPVRLIGLLHVVADGLKSFFKESFAPSAADKVLFALAPLIGFVTTLCIVALIPFGPDLETASLPGARWLLSQETLRAYPVIPLQVARLDAGLLYVFALGSLSIYGAALAGWASNNRFALLGGLRASAQSISYEIALGLTTVGMLIVCGSTELSEIVHAQGRDVLFGLPAWGIVVQPLAAVLFLTAAIAECKRGPFDLPEGEPEIIGYFVEYSSMSFGLFMLTEFMEVAVLGALFTTMFLGGSDLPWVMRSDGWHLGVWQGVPDFLGLSPSLWNGLAGLVVFGVKVFLVSALQLQIRWTLPRFRYDQLMHLGWKILLPLALVNIFVTAGLVYADQSLRLLALVGVAQVAIFAVVVALGPSHKPIPAPAHSH